MDKIRKNLHLLRYLRASENSIQRKRLIESATRDQIATFSEISLNILNGVFEISDQELSSLERYKFIYRKLADRRVNDIDKRRSLLRHSVSLKNLLTVFFNHWSEIQSNGRKHQEINSYSTKSVQSVNSESGEPNTENAVESNGSSDTNDSETN